MVLSGLFIPLFDQDTLNLYVEKGVYGELRPPVFNEVNSRSKHYAALADCACARDGTHVFFFNERQIFYGGQVIGSKDYGSYFFNGPYSPMGRSTASSICWDESSRNIHKKTDKPGIFRLKTKDQKEKCQPYFIKFEDRINLKGFAIESDELYTELNLLHHPVPSNAIQEMSLCTMTPGEVKLLLKILSEKGEYKLEPPKDNIDLIGTPILFEPKYGISHLAEAKSKYHHDSMIMSDPLLLPANLQPSENTIICRRVPLGPFKPTQLDRADMCYYTSDSPDGATLPSKIIELEQKRAGNTKVKKLVKYIKWLDKIIPNELSNISFNLLAPSFRSTVMRDIPDKYKNQIHLIQWVP